MQKVYNKKNNRFISRKEALAIAREILARAERERIKIAEIEASHGIQWENNFPESIDK